MRRNRSCLPFSALPWIDHAPVTPLDPIAYRAVVVRSERQGRRRVFQRANSIFSVSRLENVCRRRSIALDGNQHDGRLTSVRDGGPCAAIAVFMALLIAGTITVTLPCAAMANPLVTETQTTRTATAVASPDLWADHIAEAAKRFAIPERWIRAVMAVESAGDVRALSAAGAMGLMQIMPVTWEELRAKHGLGNDPYDVHNNVLAGAAYLREMHDRYGSITGTLAAYNAGPGRYERHLAGERLPAETVEYVARIMPMIDTQTAYPLPIRHRSAGSETAGGPLFAVTTNGASASLSPLFAAPPAIRTDDGQTADDHPSGRPSSVGTITDPSALAPLSYGLFIPRSAHGVAE